jgi:two-component system cell cycle sensor histidine kinase/response regulator CckA
MANHRVKERDSSVLRKRAEEFLVKKPKVFDEKRYKDIQALVHELSVYQVEMEMQNDELRQAQLELQASRDRYLDLYNDAPVAYLTLDEQASILEANATGLELFGVTREDLINSTLTHFISPESQDVFYLHAREIFKTGAKQSYELILRKKDGAVFHARIESKGLPAPDGSITGQRITIIDITESKRLEAEQQKIEKLESLGTLAAGIAHDFNNYLAGIMGNVSLAIRCVESKGSAMERLEEVERACLKAKDLTQQLLVFSRGGMPIKTRISMGKLIREIATFALRGSRVKPVFFLPDDLWTVEADEGQINQVISNIVINADQAMPRGGTIDITAANHIINSRKNLPLPPGNYIHVAIKDTGIGIPEEHSKRIFDPFFTTKQKGSGLGLTTAFSIVKNHDGYITFESEPGAGTTFHVYLPTTDKPGLAEDGAMEKTPIHGTGRILVMDDEDIIREMLEKMLNLAGYEVELAADGAEAIERYRGAKESGRPFDAVIMDLTIPGGMGGKKAIRELIKIDPNVKAIVSSGYATDPIMSDYKKYGFSAVVTKPYSVAHLEETLLSIFTKTR